ncbi:AAA family ATPase [Natribacillus halophilus]|uniref:Stage V sporulation protein K n=1 Tax=Natribacillus halophilus TaxID=549003 RepID=A0A1G8PTJ6_9BACI|nr:AAA family ATPase [Natribacillus halophilus]SDI95668.1 stage V sporulation protein K [Natribacillus halophilus]
MNAQTSKSRIRVLIQDRERDQQQREAMLADPDHYILQKAEKQLYKLVGVNELKTFIREIYAWIHINRCREKHQLKTKQQSMHMIFKGSPGTGKTTAARLLGEMFRELGFLEKGHFIEAERGDLVGEYIGQTAQKTKALVQKAEGGILFVDEAYALARGGEKDFGKEAVDTLVKAMDDNLHPFVLILAGYSTEMNRFLNMNPGLPSRFPVQLEFPDFTTEQLLEIAENMLGEREYIWTSAAKEQMEKKIQLRRAGKTEHSFSNGRYIRNEIEQAIRYHAVRTMREKKEHDKEALKTLIGADFK